MVQSGAGLRHFSVSPASENPFIYWEKQLSCTQNHNLFLSFYVIINVIYSLDDKR